MNLRGVVCGLLWSAIFCVLSVGLADNESGSGEAPRLSYDVDVDLVQVVVRVTDARGGWVSGIQPRDLVVLEDGKRQEVLYADEIAASVAAPAATAGEGDQEQPQLPQQRQEAEAGQVQQQNRVALVFDACSSNKISLERHKRSVRDFITRFPDSNASFSILMIRPSGGYQTLAPFTSDRAVLLKAIDSVQGGAQGIEDRNRKAAQLSSPLSIDQCSTDMPAAMNRFGTSCQEAALRTMVQRAAVFAAEERVRSRNAIYTLVDFLRKAGNLAGRKTLVFVSEGFDPGGMFFYNYAANLIDYFSDRYILPERTRRVMLSELTTQVGTAGGEAYEIQKLADVANEADVTLYWVNPGYGNKGGETSVDLDGPSHFGHRYFNAPDIDVNMRGLAENTGGLAMASSNADRFYQQLNDVIPRYYLVGYKPSRHARDGQVHRLEVKPANGDYHVEFRKQFLDFTTEQRMANAIARAHDAPAEEPSTFHLLSHIEYFRNSGQDYRVFLRTGIRYRDISPQMENRKVSDDIHFAYLVRTEDGKTVVNEHKVVKIRSAFEEFEQLKDRDALLEYMQVASLKPGRYDISLVVTDSAGGAHDSDQASLALSGGDNGAGCLSLSPVLLATDIAKTKFGGGRSAECTEKGTIRYGDRTYDFGILRVFPENGRLTGFYQVYDANDDDPLWVSFALYRGETFINRTAEHQLPDTKQGKQQQRSEFFSVPYSNLVPGSYQLEVHVRGTAENCTGDVRVPFVIRGGGGGGEEMPPLQSASAR